MAEEDIRVTFQEYVADQNHPDLPRDGWFKRLLKRCLNRITRGEYKSVREQWSDY